MGLIGRLAAGAGAGVASIGQKYIDEEIAANKARLLADLQLQGQIKLDEYTNSPKRRGDMRALAADDERAKNTVVLEGEIARATNPELRKAAVDTEAAKITGLIPAKLAAYEQLGPAEAKAAGLKKLAESENSAYELSPGQQRFIGSKQIANNSRATSQEVTANLYERGLRGAGGGGAGKATKMDESDKLTYQSLIKAQQQAEEDLRSGVSKGGIDLTPDKDGKPSPNVAFLQKNIAEAKRNLLAFQARKGLLNPQDMASRITAGESDQAKIALGIEQAYSLDKEFGDEVYKAIRESGALERAAENSKQNPQAKRVAPTAATAPTMALPNASREALLEQANRLAGDVKARQQQKAAADDQGKAALRQQAAAITRDVASRMSPSQAAAALSKYQSVLPADVLAELRRNQ